MKPVASWNLRHLIAICGAALIYSIWKTWINYSPQTISWLCLNKFNILIRKKTTKSPTTTNQLSAPWCCSWHQWFILFTKIDYCPWCIGIQGQSPSFLHSAEPSTATKSQCVLTVLIFLAGQNTLKKGKKNKKEKQKWPERTGRERAALCSRLQGSVTEASKDQQAACAVKKLCAFIPLPLVLIKQHNRGSFGCLI